MSWGLRRKRTRRRVDVPATLAGLTEALHLGGDELEPDAVHRAREVMGRTDDRMRLGADHTVVALAGATGSGKSSTFNAVVGLELSQVGVRRPTTSTPSASVWGARSAGPLLDWLEVPARHRIERESALDAGEQAALHGLVLLDLPDHDSTEVAHRLEVDRLVKLVDVLVWVVDPQKYADEALHARYLRNLVGHEAVVLVVLNQVDTLTPEEASLCRADLMRLLRADGLTIADDVAAGHRDGVRVLTVSARTGEGIDVLRSELVGAVQARRAMTARAAADLGAVAEGLRPSVADTEPSLDTDRVTDSLVDALAVAAGVPIAVEAVVTDYRRGAARRTGWPPTRWAARLRPDPMKRFRLSGTAEEVPGTVREESSLRLSSLPQPTPAQLSRVQSALAGLGQDASAGLPPRWERAARGAVDPAGSVGADLTDALDQAVVGTPLPLVTPRWWRMAGVLQTLLTASAIVGVVWLAVLGVLGWLQIPTPQTPSWGLVPLPTILLVAGSLGGFVLAVICRRIAVSGSRRRGDRAEQVLRAAVREAAAKTVVAPLAEVLDRHRRTREALDAVSGP